MVRWPIVTTTASGASDDDVAGLMEERRWALEALSSLGDGVLIVDELMRLVYHNDAAMRLIGANVLSAKPETWSAAYGIFYPDERTHFASTELPLLRALAGERVDDVEMFVRNGRTPAGIHLSCSAGALRDETGHVRGATVIFHDITRRRAQHLQLLEGERQKRAMLDNIPDIAWLKDREGRFVAVNMPFALAAGRPSPEAVLGQTDFDLWPEELAARYVGDDNEIMRTGLHMRVEEPLMDARGIVHWIESFKTCITGDSGEVIGTTGIARDITERKHAEQALRMTNDELERRVALRTQELAEAQENLVQAMPDGGTLRLAMWLEGEQVLITVTDTGAGISPQVRSHLFEPLHSTKPMGIGLGLITARTFIEAHGGRIAHVDVPTGACFEIRLPLPCLPPPPEAPAAER